MQTLKLYLLTGVLLVAGPALIVSTPFGYLSQRDFAERGVTTLAEVGDARAHAGRRGATNYKLDLRYETADGPREKTLGVSESAYQTALTHGSIEVRYDPDRPDRVRAASRTPMSPGGAIASMFFGGVLLGVGVWSARRIRDGRHLAEEEPVAA